MKNILRWLLRHLFPQVLKDKDYLCAVVDEELKAIKWSHNGRNWITPLDSPYFKDYNTTAEKFIERKIKDVYKVR